MNELTDDRLAELRKIAEAATPGDWCVGVDRDGTAVAIDCGDGYADVLQGGPVSCMDYCYGGVSTVEARDADWAHMVAFDPPTVLALLSDVKRLREERDDMRRRLDAVEALARNGIGKPCNRTLDRIILAARGPRE